MKVHKFIVGVFFSMAILLLSDLKVSADNNMGTCGGSRGSFKSYMPMTALSKSSPQYKYLQNNTYDRDNLRVTNDGFIAVAMGSYYGVLGDKFIITFDNGQQTKVVKVDEKADRHTSAECRGISMSSDGSIVEVITTTGSADTSSNPALFRELALHGNAGMVYKEFAGTSGISKIEKVNGSVESQKPNNTREKSFDDQEDPEGKAMPSHSSLPEEESNTEEERIVAYYIPRVAQDRLIFLDTEFTEHRELIQAAFIVLERYDGNCFFLTSSLNVYVNIRVSPSFENFTGIKGGFLGNEGLKPGEALIKINRFLEVQRVNEDETLVIGHGLGQDLDILQSFGCDIYPNEYDTHIHAKSLLKREKNLKLSDLLLDAGLVQGVAHDAYQDTRNLIPIFSHLKWLEDFERRQKGR